MKSNRIIYIDILKAIAIFCVLWGHSIQSFYSKNFYSSHVWLLINSFHMPLFMAISGYFGQKLLEKDIKTFVSQKFIQLILPTIIYGIFFSLYINRIYVYSLWFLKSLFCCSCLFYFSKRSNSIFILFISLIISQFIPLFAINKMYPCFILGSFLCDLINNEILYKRLKYVFFLCLVVYLLLLFNWNDGLINTSGVGLSYSNLSLEEIRVYSIQHYYRLIMGLSGATAIIIGAYFLSKIIKFNLIGDKISDIGKKTLEIYILQSLILETLCPLFIDSSNIDITFWEIIVAPLLSLIILALCLLLIKFISKFGIFNLLIFGKRTKYK